MAWSRESEFDEDDEVEEEEEDEVTPRRPPPRIGGSNRAPISKREYPVDEPDFEDDGTDPCPYCGKPIYADGEWCPKCGHYLSQEDAPSKRSLTVMVVIIALVLVTVVTALLAR